MKYLPILLVGLLIAFGRVASAQDGTEQRTAAPHVLKADHYDAHTRVLPVQMAGKTAQPTANIQVTYQGFSPEAQAAFQYAVDLWEQHISSPVPIRILASWEELEENVLGSAGPSTFYGNFANAPMQSTWYPLGLAHALAGQRFDGAPAYDIHANFSSSMSWYFGTDARPPAGTFDLVTVVLHEIGHGLGFFQTYQVDDGDDDERDECPGVGEGFGCWGLAAQGGGNPFPAIFDRFVEDEEGTSLLNESVYPNPSRALGDVLQSGAVRFNGPSALDAFQNVPIDLYSPAGFEPASSIAHLDEDVFLRGDPNSLMTPRLARAEAIHSPGPVFCGLLEDLGWTLGDACFALISADIITFEAQRASLTGGEVTLEWTTGADAELDEFVIEQSRFGRAYEEVARLDFIPGERDYEITLQDLVPGRYTYRIRYTRQDASTALSRSAEVTIPLTEQVAVSGPYPNPIQSRATVHVLVRRAQRVDAYLYDAMGRRIRTVASSRQVAAQSEVTFEIERGSLASGVYYLQIIGREFNTTTSLVITR